MPPKTAKKETVDRNRRRTVTGVVTGDKMDKTIKVRVERFVTHPTFEKTLKRTYVCYAHDEKREARSGDKVELMETRPMSRLKHWRLLRVVEKGARTADDARAAARPSAAPSTEAPAGPKA
ncbi:MAG TPA: 30S ribosomal protein S17 [Planctomycetota bacterium]|nr:30S ribosomal protein S17 [Planctomycetota bacterium]